jgi:MFS family permease
MRSAFILASVTSLISAGILSRMDFSSVPDDSDDDATAAPATYGAVFRNRSVRSLFALHGITILSLAIGVSLVPIFLKDVRGFEPSLIASLGAASAVGTGMYGIFVSRTASLARTPLRAASISCAAIAIGMVIVAVSGSLWWISLAFFLRGGMFATWALILAEMGDIAPARLRSRAFAVVEILGGSAMSFGPIIASQLYRFDPATPILVGALLGGVMAMVMGWNQWKRT